MPPLTFKEFVQRSLTVGGIVSAFLVFAVIVLWLTTPAIVG